MAEGQRERGPSKRPCWPLAGMRWRRLPQSTLRLREGGPHSGRLLRRAVGGGASAPPLARGGRGGGMLAWQPPPPGCLRRHARRGGSTENRRRGRSSRREPPANRTAPPRAGRFLPTSAPRPQQRLPSTSWDVRRGGGGRRPSGGSPAATSLVMPAEEPIAAHIPSRGTRAAADHSGWQRDLDGPLYCVCTAVGPRWFVSRFCSSTQRRAAAAAVGAPHLHRRGVSPAAVAAAARGAPPLHAALVAAVAPLRCPPLPPRVARGTSVARHMGGGRRGAATALPRPRTAPTPLGRPGLLRKDCLCACPARANAGWAAAACHADRLHQGVPSLGGDRGAHFSVFTNPRHGAPSQRRLRAFTCPSSGQLTRWLAAARPINRRPSSCPLPLVSLPHRPSSATPSPHPRPPRPRSG